MIRTMTTPMPTRTANGCDERFAAGAGAAGTWLAGVAATTSSGMGAGVSLPGTACSGGRVGGGGEPIELADRNCDTSCDGGAVDGCAGATSSPGSIGGTAGVL